MTSYIAIAIGVYSFAAGVGIFINPGKVERLLEGLRANPALSYITGIFVYAIGAVGLMAHHTFNGVMETIVTLILIGAVIEGLAFLIGPGAFIALSQRMAGSASMKVWGVIACAAGGALILAGALL